MYTPAIASASALPLLTRPRQLHVFVHLVHGFGARRWAKIADARVCGIVDHLPYGYYRAADQECTIEYSQDSEEWRLVKLIRLSARHLLGFDIVHAWRNRDAMLKADVIWTHTELEHLAVLLLIQIMRSHQHPKVIAQSVWLYDRWEHFWAPKRWLYRKLLERADLLTVLSPSNQLIARKLFPYKRIEFLKFGIDHGALTAPKPRKLDTTIHLLALGRDMHRDWDTLINAVRNYEICDLRIGSNSLHPSAIRGANNISLVAPKTEDEIAELYRWADILVLSLKPNCHASGITVLEEAALFGVPVIATDTGGLRAYFAGDEVQYVPASDVQLMRKAITELAANSGLRYALAKRAQERMVRDDLTSVQYALRHKELSYDLIQTPEEGRSK